MIRRYPPTTLVTFEGFGDNALNLGLGCSVPSLNDRLQTITDLHRANISKFNEADIIIDFPPQDVYFDATSPLENPLTRGAPSAANVHGRGLNKT